MKTHKKCNSCKLEKPVDQFYVAKQGKSGPIFRSSCKECESLAAKKRWKGLTPEQKRAQQHKTNSNKSYHKNYRLVNKYGITLEQFNAMYEEQQGQCAICDVEVPDDQIRVDHCHTTEAVRALLCHNCNAAIGLLKEDARIMQRCIDYVNTHNT